MNNIRLLPLIFLLLLSIPVIIWYQQTGSLAIYFSSSTPPGQLLYVLSKLIGMVALLCIAWQLIVTSLCKFKVIPNNWFGLPHQIFGLFTLLSVVTHVLLFFFAVSIRQGEPAWSLFFPDFHDFYHIHLTMGLFSLIALIIVVIAGLLRVLTKVKNSALLHRFYWISIGLAYLHALAVGSEAQAQAGLVFYVVLGLLVVLLSVGYVRRSRMSLPIS